jgi:hypothetical protein
MSNRATVIRRSLGAGRLAAGAALLAACAVLQAGCGASAASTGTGSASAASSPVVLYADCVRTHGVPDYPDAGPGIVGDQSGIDTQAPAYHDAQRDCAKLAPGAVAHHKTTERQKTLAVAFSRCVRAHGLPSFPDPVLSVPPPGVAHGIVRAGMYWPLPVGTVQSPRFSTAAVACGWTGTPHAAAG